MCEEPERFCSIRLQRKKTVIINFEVNLLYPRGTVIIYKTGIQYYMQINVFGAGKLQILILIRDVFIIAFNGKEAQKAAYKRLCTKPKCFQFSITLQKKFVYLT